MGTGRRREAALSRVAAGVRLEDPAAAEVAADLDEVAWLAETARTRLARARREAHARRSGFHRRTLVTYIAQSRSAEDALGSIEAQARAAAGRPRPGARGERDRLAAERAAAADLVRMQFSVAASLVVAADWQSPAFGAAAGPGAGRFDGAVVEHHDDYKRDRHPDAGVLERHFAREFGGAPGVRALLTSCGMSAFTTLLAYLERRRPPRGRVVVGRGLYHECRALLGTGTLGRRAVEVDENDTGAIVGALDDGGVLFIDALCNARGLALCDLRRILDGAARRDVTVVVDTTCLSASCRPFRLLPPGARCRLLVFESLTKYAQFGLDRTAAGLILAAPEDADALDDLREHLGTNVADVAACMLPGPNRARLLRRLHRMERNARVIARHLGDVVGSRRGPVTGVVYPGLADHPSHRATLGVPFAGALLHLSFDDAADADEVHGAAVDAMLDEARAAGVPLNAGASFGFDVTRVYRTAAGSGSAAFVRIAPGIEDAAAAGALARAVARACARL